MQTQQLAQKYANMYPVDFYGVPKKVEYNSLNERYDLLIDVKGKKTQQLKGTATDVELMIWRFFGGWKQPDPKRSDHINFLSLKPSEIVAQANKKIANEAELRFIANEENWIKVVASTGYTPILPEELYERTVEILKKRKLSSETTETFKTPAQVYTVPISAPAKQEALETLKSADKLTKGIQPFLTLDVGDNWYSQSITIGFAAKILVCSNGMVATRFFGDPVRIHRYSSVDDKNSHNDFAKREVFFKRFEKVIDKLAEQVVDRKSALDGAIVEASKHRIVIAEQKKYIQSLNLAEYVKEEIVAQIEKSKDETRWGLSQAITYIASHATMRSDRTAYTLEMIGGQLLYEKQLVIKEPKAKPEKKTQVAKPKPAIKPATKPAPKVVAKIPAKK